MPVSFRFDGWERVVGNKRCFHLVGFYEVLRQLGIRTAPDLRGKKAKVPAAEIVAKTIAMVPESWKRDFGQDDAHRQVEWSEFSVQQILALCSREPALLSKAMMALLFVELMILHLNEARQAEGKEPITLDIYEEVRIEPAVFWVEGFDTTFYEAHLNTRQDNQSRRDHLLSRLKKASNQPRPRVFADIAQHNRTCLFATAQAIVEVFKDMPEIGDAVEFEVFGARDKQPPSVDEIANYKRRIPEVGE